MLLPDRNQSNERWVGQHTGRFPPADHAKRPFRSDVLGIPQRFEPIYLTAAQNGSRDIVEKGNESC